MYYIDIRSAQEDKVSHLSEVFNILHKDVFSRYLDNVYVIAIPTTEKRRLDKFVLGFYGIVRIFSNTIHELDIIKQLIFEDISYSDITEVDFGVVTSWVYYKQYKISKDIRFKSRQLAHANEYLPYFKIRTSSSQNFSLYIEKISAELPGDCTLLTTNSYGISRLNNMVAVPELYL